MITLCSMILYNRVTFPFLSAQYAGSCPPAPDSPPAPLLQHRIRKQERTQEGDAMDFWSRRVKRFLGAADQEGS